MVVNNNNTLTAVVLKSLETKLYSSTKRLILSESISILVVNRWIGVSGSHGGYARL